MNPQDLLYTNEFLTTETITNRGFEDNRKNHVRYRNFVDKNVTNETDQYIQNDSTEGDPFNLNKRQLNKFPVGRNANHYPLFDSYIQDVSKGTYEKEYVTKLNIDSILRDKTVSPSSGSFSLQFSKVFNNVSKLVINNINIPNPLQSINQYNNNIAWQYPTKNQLLINNSASFIIPTPNDYNLIDFLTLNNSCSTLSDVNDLFYETNIDTGSYTVSSLSSKIRAQTTSVYHGETKKNLETGTTTYTEQPYIAYPNLIKTAHQFTVDINPITNNVKMVNRIEEVRILALQSFGPYTVDNSTDIFNSYSDNPAHIINPDFIYVLLPYIQGVTDQYYNSSTDIPQPKYENAFPLVITGLNQNIGNIEATLINYTEFFDLGIYLDYGYTESQITSIPTYQYWDKITINTNVYLRFALKLSSGKLNGLYYDKFGNTIKPITNDTIIYDNYLSNFFNYSSNINLNINIFIGRALLFRWIFDKQNGNYINFEFDSNNVKKKSILNILSWPIANQTYNQICIIQNQGFAFVQNNYNGVILDADSFNGLPTEAQQSLFSKSLRIPPALNIQYENGEYFFITPGYIFISMNLSKNSSNDSFKDYYALSSGNMSYQYNQNYVGPYFNVGIGDEYSCELEALYGVGQLKPIKTDNIYAKIQISNIPNVIDNNASNININGIIINNYDKPMDNFNSMEITLLDPYYREITYLRNFSFTVEVHEIVNVLKETLIDSKRNNVSVTGKRIV